MTSMDSIACGIALLIVKGLISADGIYQLHKRSSPFPSLLILQLLTS